MQRTIATTADIAEGLGHLARTDKRLAAAIASAGEVPLRRSEPGFASLASIVVSQQVSKASADAIQKRLEGLIVPLTPGQFLAAGEETWRLAGLSRPKQRTLAAISQAVIDGALDLNGLCDLPAQTAMDQLTAVHGVGPWTAEVYLLFAAGHADIMPAGDLALQAAAHRILGLDQRPTAKELRDLAESWAPWRGVAARLLWAWYGQEAGRAVMP